MLFLSLIAHHNAYVLLSFAVDTIACALGSAPFLQELDPRLPMIAVLCMAMQLYYSSLKIESCPVVLMISQIKEKLERYRASRACASCR